MRAVRAQRERLRQDPGPDGLRAEERPVASVCFWLSARKLPYTASVLAGCGTVRGAGLLAPGDSDYSARTSLLETTGRVSRSWGLCAGSAHSH